MPINVEHGIINNPTCPNPGYYWPSLKYEAEICEAIADDNTLVISPTFRDIDIIKNIAYTYLNENPGCSVKICPFYDPWNKENFLEIANNHSNIELIDATKINYWMHAVDKFFVEYTDEEIKPTTFEYDFLCYQRKPYPTRQLRYDALKDLNGIITLGGNTYDFNEGVGKGTDEIMLGEDSKTIPNDMYSLGNLDIWQKSFLVITAETCSTNSPWASEKTWKPIIGKRPFVLCDNEWAPTYLKSKGFEIFDDEFGIEYVSECGRHGDNPTPEVLVEVVKNLQGENLEAYYKELEPKIEHNYHQYKKLVAEQKQRLTLP